MKFHCFRILLGLSAASFLPGQTLVQTFEEGENTDNWNSSWNAPGGWTFTENSFLDASLGGSHAAGGNSTDGQTAYREFRDNTADYDHTDTYTVSLYINVTSANLPASGKLQVLDGDIGASAVQFQLEGSNPEFWQYFDYNANSWVDTSVAWTVGDINLIEYTYNFTNKTYSFEISRVNSAGVALSAVSSGTDISSNPGLNPNQFGKLTLHVEGSAGNVDLAVDNINIGDFAMGSLTPSAVPEPASFGVVLAGLVGFGAMFSRRRHRAANV